MKIKQVFLNPEKIPACFLYTKLQLCCTATNNAASYLHVPCKVNKLSIWAAKVVLVYKGSVISIKSQGNCIIIDKVDEANLKVNFHITEGQEIN